MKLLRKGSALSFFNEVIFEFKNIKWLEKKALISQLILILVISVIFSLFFSAIDYAVLAIMKFFMLNL